MVSHWSLSDQKSPQVSSDLADLNNAEVWMVSTCPLSFTSSSAFTSPLRIVPSTPITIGITVTLLFSLGEFFTPVVTGIVFFLLKSETQQVSSGLQNFSKYSSWPQTLQSRWPRSFLWSLVTPVMLIINSWWFLLIRQRYSHSFRQNYIMKRENLKLIGILNHLNLY